MRILGSLTLANLGLAGAPSAESPEARLLSRLQGADDDAFRELFDRFAPAVRRFLKDLLRDDAAADEATQETFVRAHRKIRGLGQGAKLTAWLLGIARNVAFETRRSQRASTTVAVSALDDGEGHPDLLVAVLPVPTPEALLLGGETDALLAEAMQALAPERRAALLLRLDHGLAYEEIAEAMGWSLQKVKNEIHRARLQLRERLAHHLGVTP